MTQRAITLSTIAVILVLVGLCVLGLWGCPLYNVYVKSKAGQGLLEEAEYTRQIAKLDAEAEVARAKGIAAADSIISEGLEDSDNYLTYLWIQALQTGNCEVIYVATEGGMPITEAQRLAKEGMP